MARYTDMSSLEMLQALGTDASKWADAFCERFPAVPNDEALGWFANAMMAQWDITNSAITHNDESLIDHIGALVRNRDLWREIGNAAPASLEGASVPEPPEVA